MYEEDHGGCNYCFDGITGNNTRTQLRKIPAVVTNAFKEMFPEALDVTWKDKLTGFQASFKMEDVKYEDRFSIKGEWKLTENEITGADIPAEVQEGIAHSQNKDWESMAVSLVEDPDSQQFMLVVQKSALQKKNLYFTFHGKLVRDPIAL
ncbi:MAG: PepSY-like domain-containing protein [Chitinophagaceae bacterium]